jgi:transcriptional regulator with XRE-family HTH domain
MLSLITPAKAQSLIASHVRDRRVNLGLTQAGLAARADIPLPTLRRFEQQGLVSLEGLLKILSVVGGLDEIIKALEVPRSEFLTIDDVLKPREQPRRKKGWRA